MTKVDSHEERESQDFDNTISAKCIATTSEQFNTRTQKPSDALQTSHSRSHESNFFHSAQFSADGTTIVTHNEDQSLRTFILPHDLLDDTESPSELTAISKDTPASNVQSFAIYPGFNLQDTSTTLTLRARASVPIQLCNALAWDMIHASYQWIDTNTEAFLSARSLIFTSTGSHFIAGGDNRIALFDCSRNGSGPITSHALRPSRQARRSGYGNGAAECHGIVSSMHISPDTRMLAIGTLSRQVALYGDESAASCTAGFSIAFDRSEQAQFGGTGVSQVQWSSCGEYLLVAERQSDAVQVYDVRNTYRRLAILTGRQARSPQRLGMDVVRTATGCELWAGTVDGHVRMWSEPGKLEGLVRPSDSFSAATIPISSTIWHPAGAVLATCSGTRQRHDLQSQDDSESESTAGSADSESDADASALPAQDHAGGLENALKIWTV